MQRNRKKLAGSGKLDPKLYAAAGRFMAARGFGGGFMSAVLEKLRAVENDV